jgi:hypothetical protein
MFVCTFVISLASSKLASHQCTPLTLPYCVRACILLYFTAYDCKEDCSLYALDSGFLVVSGYKLKSLQASHY